MANPIVTVNTTVTLAPIPSTLQQTGALVSVGGTTLPSGTFSLLTQASSLTALLASALAVTSLAWSGGTVTATTTDPHGVATSDTFLTTISGATPANYNGTFLATATGASTFTYALASDDGTTPATGTIIYTPRNVAELVAMNTTFWAQGTQTSVYVLELGAGEPAAAITALGAFITANPFFFYAYLVPSNWDGISGFLALGVTYNSPSAMVYFYVMTTSGTYADYLPTMKAIRWLLPAPGAAITEFQAAGWFWDLLNTSPSSANPVSPFEYRYQYGVTPWPAGTNGTLLTAVKAAGGNYIASGSEVGVSTAFLKGGQGSDKITVNFWYSVDWTQINVNLNLANAVVNGSQPSSNPLDFDQDGINTLQQVAAGTMNSGVTYRLVLNPVIQTGLSASAFAAAIDAGTFAQNTVVNADPFVSYTTENPNDYAVGKYAGFSIAYTPLRGFDQIIVNLNASQFA